MNQKTLNVIYGIVGVILIGGVIYFAIGKKTETTTNQPVVTPATNNTSTPQNIATSTEADSITNRKTYTNTRYAYTIKYPSNWFVDTSHSESDFTARGPAESSDLIGGDTFWSNYENPGQYDLGTLPRDFAAVYLFVYKADAQITLDKFIDSKRYPYIKRENATMNGQSAVRLTFENPENPNETGIAVLFKANNKTFNFSYARNSALSVTVMDEMLKTFKLK